MTIEYAPNALVDVTKVQRSLPPRVAQTLDLLLEGGSEKEVALQLGVSHHTVHVYVKAIYRHLEVSSRAELMATCLRR